MRAVFSLIIGFLTMQLQNAEIQNNFFLENKPFLSTFKCVRIKALILYYIITHFFIFKVFDISSPKSSNKKYSQFSTLDSNIKN